MSTVNAKLKIPYNSIAKDKACW